MHVKCVMNIPCFDIFFFLSQYQGFPQDLGFWPPRGTSQKKVEFFFFFNDFNLCGV